MQEYIDSALRHLNPESPRIGGKKIKYQNRVIQFAAHEYAKDPKNLRVLYDNPRKDIVTDELRAQHYGVSIGTQIGWRTGIKKQRYYHHLARVMKEIKRIVRTNDIDLVDSLY